MVFMFKHLFFCMCVCSLQLFSFSQIHTYHFTKEDQKADSVIWTVSDASDFNELLLSWNAMRPEEGKFIFSVSVKTNNWSPFMPYAEWSADGQKTFSTKVEQCHLTAYQDTVNTTDGMLGKGFRVKVEAKEGAHLNTCESIHICTSNLNDYSMDFSSCGLEKVVISPIKGKSQMILPHERARDLCSPTSTSTVVNFLKEDSVDPAIFADLVHDDGFDIYGNWALNVAEAYASLNGDYSCRIERLAGFDDLHAHLLENMPVVVSVKGQIPGAPIAYKSGHLMVITGFDPENQRVYCIDSAFDSDEKTVTHYALKDFLQVWSVRKNLAYIFSKN